MHNNVTNNYNIIVNNVVEYIYNNIVCSVVCEIGI